MRTLSRVVWREGMYLAQHHFQHQARYFEDLVDFSVGALRPASYGFLSLALDDEALTNGAVVVKAGAGVMPDGLAFEFPDDPAPEQLLLPEIFPSTREGALVHLSIGTRRSAYSGQGDAAAGERYREESRTYVDEFHGGEESEVVTARKEFRLVLGDHPPDGQVGLPLARVKRVASGSFVYDRDFVPPCLRVGAVPHLVGRLERLTEVLAQKADSLRGIGQESGNDIAGPWLAHAVNTGLAALRHHSLTGSSHPEEIFLILSRLASSLCTFAMDSVATELPVYDHDNLGPVFSALEDHVKSHLPRLSPSKRPAIRLVQSEPCRYFARISDPRLLRPGARWYLGIRSDRRGPAELATTAAGLIKLVAGRHLAKAIGRSRDGMALRLETNPPTAIDPLPDRTYFRIETQSGLSKALWSTIVDPQEGSPEEETGRVGAYVPESFGDAELELTILPPEG